MFANAASQRGPLIITTLLRRGFAAFLAPAILIPVMTSPAPAQVDGVSYTLTPTVNVLRWDGESGLEDTELLGGRLSYNLGRHVSLQGYYMGRNNVETMLSNLSLRDGDGAPIVDRRVDILN